MKIYFTASTAEFDNYKQNYFTIRDYLIAQNHLLTHDWLYRAEKRIQARQENITDIREIYRDCKRGINNADLVIIEDTVSNFSTGHQITLALQRQKPTLVLWNKPKHLHFKQTFIQGLDSEILDVEYYKLPELPQIIDRFINKYSDHNKKTRFNLVLTEVERKYLEWAKFNKRITRTKLIRQAIRSLSDKDENYQKYLRHGE